MLRLKSFVLSCLIAYLLTNIYRHANMILNKGGDK